MIQVHCGDITQLHIDVIVNAANNCLLGGGGVDGAIHRAAGPEFLEACRALKGCETGDAKITLGYKLSVCYVIHTVGLIWAGGTKGEAGLLESCYRRCFEVALENDARGIVFPCISTGVYGFPKAQAAKISVRVMHEFEQQFDSIIACCFSQDDAQCYKILLNV